MKGIYLLDACNIVRAGSWDPGRDDDAESRAFIARIERRLVPAPRLRVVAVFDGPRRYSAAGVVLELRFSQEEPADSVILDLARAGVHEGRSVWVVSRDGALLDRAEEEGARPLSPGDFEERLGR